MGISRSCCAVIDFRLVQCTQWGIQYKLYSRLLAVNTQGLMQLTRLSRIVQVRGIHYLWDINDWVNQQLAPLNVILESLGFWIPGTGFRMSVAVRLLQIPIISRIPDSTSRITDSKSQDFAFHAQIVSPIPVSGLPYTEETTAINKQTKPTTLYGARSISHYQLSNFGTYQAIKKLTQKILMYYCLKI